MPEPTRSTAGGTSASDTQQWSGEQDFSSSTMKEKGSQAAREAGEQFRETGEQIRQSAESAAAEFRKQGAGFVQDRKVQAADQLNSFSAAIRSAADRLHEENDHNLAGYAEAAAERVEGAARYLGERDFSRIADDVEGFARRQPELFLGGMFLAGMGISRFLKASRQHSSSTTSTPGAYASSGSMRSPGTIQGASTPQTASTVRTTPGYRAGAEAGLF